MRGCNVFQTIRYVIKSVKRAHDTHAPEDKISEIEVEVSYDPHRDTYHYKDGAWRSVCGGWKAQADVGEWLTEYKEAWLEDRDTYVDMVLDLPL